jgi:hypothetical protein
VALRRLRKLKLSSLGWTEQTYENKNELLQPKQQSRKTAVMRVVNFEIGLHFTEKQKISKLNFAKF